MSEKISDITGVVLAGGRSERFGENKAFVRYQGVPFIERVLGVVRPLFEEVLIVTNTPESYRHLGCVVTDLEPYQGPLGGIFTAFRKTQNDRIFVVGCDMPLLDPAVILEIIAKGPASGATIPLEKGNPQYLMAVYSRRILPEICRFLQDGGRSLQEFCSRVTDIRWLPVPGHSGFSVNTPEDLRRLEAGDAL